MDKGTYPLIDENCRDFLRGAMNAGYNPGSEAGNSRYRNALAS